MGDADVHDDEIDDDGGEGGDTDGEDDEINFELEVIAVDEVSEDEEDRDIDFIRRNDFWKSWQVFHKIVHIIWIILYDPVDIQFIFSKEIIFYSHWK